MKNKTLIKIRKIITIIIGFPSAVCSWTTSDKSLIDHILHDEIDFFMISIISILICLFGLAMLNQFVQLGYVVL